MNWTEPTDRGFYRVGRKRRNVTQWHEPERIDAIKPGDIVILNHKIQMAQSHSQKALHFTDVTDRWMELDGDWAERADLAATMDDATVYGQ